MSQQTVYKLVPYDEVSSALRTKFGGNPDWLEEPQWPLSAETERPMRFICQVKLGDIFSELSGKMAYLFMTEEEDVYVDATWEHDGGENAVIVQPGGTPLVPFCSRNVGPTRGEFDVVVNTLNDGAYELEGVRIGGEPSYLSSQPQPDIGSDWRFLIQVDSYGLPFKINFGEAGVGYAFINTAGDSGKFLWQSI